MKKHRKLFVFLGIVGSIVLFWVGSTLYHNEARRAKLLGGMNSMSDKEYTKMLKSTYSDISGMTQYDKLKKGLLPENGSDTDGDGLSDRDEIEVYGTDPLKASTAGDLYTDQYKVVMGLDPFTAIEYQGTIVFPHNECPEITLAAVDPFDCNAVIKDVTGSDSLSNYTIYKEYSVANYSGQLTMDLSEVLSLEEITLSDLEVYCSDGGSVKKYDHKEVPDQTNSIILKDKFSNLHSYRVFVVRKSTGARISTLLRGNKAVYPAGENDEKGDGLVIISPLISIFTDKVGMILYQKMDTEAKTQTLVREIVSGVNEWLGVATYSEDSPILEEMNYLEIEGAYKIFQNKLPSFELTGRMPSLWRQFFFTYFPYNLLREVKAEESHSGFYPFEDELPFGNYATKDSEGNCAGIAYLTAYVYNNGVFPGKNATTNSSNLNWDLTTDPENSTLMDKGLYDYKTPSFVEDHSVLGQFGDGLTQGEREFANMISFYEEEVNGRIDLQKYTVIGQDYYYDYDVIQQAMSYLDQGKVLNAYMLMLDGSGHAVNIYDYFNDPFDADTIWFRIYDSNYPQDLVEGANINNGFCSMKVTKKLNLNGVGYSFSYDYYPVTAEPKYRATSIFSNERYALVLADEELNVFNPENYKGVYDFDYHYTASGIDEIDSLNPYQVHFRDDYFTRDSYGPEPLDGYNQSLATTSLMFAETCFDRNTGGKSDDDAHYAATQKYLNAYEYLENAGFRNLYHNAWYDKKPIANSVGVIIGSKKIKVQEEGGLHEYTLVAVGIRGGGYEAEWAGNFNIGYQSNGIHKGFATARDQVLEEINKYLEGGLKVRNYAKGATVLSDGVQGDIKLWITGYSRASATTNLTAAYIDDMIDAGESLNPNVSLKKKDLFAYGFEVPMGQLKENIPDQSKYYNIYCIVNPNDFVTKVAMECIGFSRYGVDFVLPSAAEGDNVYLPKLKRMLEVYYNMPTPGYFIDDHPISWLKGTTQESHFEEIIGKLNTKEEKDAARQKENDRIYKNWLGTETKKGFRVYEVNGSYIGSILASYKAGAINPAGSKLIGIGQGALTYWIGSVFGEKLYEEDEFWNQQEQAAYIDEALESITLNVLKNRDYYVNNYQDYVIEIFELLYRVYGTDPEYSGVMKTMLTNAVGDSDLIIRLILKTYASVDKWLDPSLVSFAADYFSDSYDEIILDYFAENWDATWQSTLKSGSGTSMVYYKEGEYPSWESVEPHYKKMAADLGALLKDAAPHINEILTLGLNVDSVAGAHYPELCLAWMISLDPNYYTVQSDLIPDKDVAEMTMSEWAEWYQQVYTRGSNTSNNEILTSNPKYRIIKVNCPVDVEILDEQGNVAGSITADIPAGDTDIRTRVNHDGEKMVYLPVGQTYTLNFTATGQGTMTVTAYNYNVATGAISDMEVYEDIPLENGSLYTAKVGTGVGTPGTGAEASAPVPDGTSGASILTFTGAGSNAVKAPVKMEEEDLMNNIFEVIVEANDPMMGLASGNDTKYYGSFAKVTATAYEGYAFEGWYAGEELVSEEPEFRFKVTEDTRLEARFSDTGKHPGKLTILFRNYWADILAIILLLAILTVVALVVVKKVRKRR